MICKSANTNNQIKIQSTSDSAAGGAQRVERTRSKAGTKVMSKYASYAQEFIHSITSLVLRPTSVLAAAALLLFTPHNPLVSSAAHATTPTVTITSDQTPPLGIGESLMVTLTFSEPIMPFRPSGLRTFGGDLRDLAGSGSSYTLTVEPTGNSENIGVSVDHYVDLDGDENESSTSLFFTTDRVRPTLTITTDPAATRGRGETFTATFTFNETVENFTADDIVVTGGTRSGFSGSGSRYTATITTASDESVTAVVVNVAADTYEDTAGNGNTQTAQVSVPVDRVSPRLLSITTDAQPPLSRGETFTATFTFSEDVMGFATDDIVVMGGGTATDLGGGGTSYTATITPLSDESVTEVALRVDADTFEDLAGNSSNYGLFTDPIAVDNTVPTLDITSDLSRPAGIGETFTATFTFSEEVTGFDGNDIMVTDGTATGFVGDGDSYTATITPSSNVNVNAVTVFVNPNAYEDLAGNMNQDRGLSTFAVDNKVPTLTITTEAPSNRPLGIGEPFTATFEFSEEVMGFTADDIVVSGGGTATGLSGTGSSYTATITPGSNATGVDIHVNTNAYEDVAGNSNTSTSQIPSAISVDSIRPTVTLASDSTDFTRLDAFAVSVRFSEAVTGFDSSDITVTGGTAINPYCD